MSWLTKFVDWLDEQSRSRLVTITSQTVTYYLDTVNRFKTKESRQRVGAQIALFVNRYMIERVHLVSSFGFEHKYDNVNMPEEHVDQIDAWLRGRLTQIKHETADRKLRRETSKLLGKYWPALVDPQLMTFVVAVAMVLHTGCRPKEAAYVVWHKTFKKNTI